MAPNTHFEGKTGISPSHMCQKIVSTTFFQDDPDLKKYPTYSPRHGASVGPMGSPYLPWVDEMRASKHAFRTSKVVPPRALKTSFEIFCAGRSRPGPEPKHPRPPPTTGHLLVLRGPPISHGLPSCLQIRMIAPPAGYGGVFSKSVVGNFCCRTISILS